MPITTPAFSSSRIIGQPSVIVLQDDSVGSDTDVVERRVYLAKADNTYLAPEGTATDYVVWQAAADQLAVEVLDRDYCLRVTVLWCNAAGTALYTASKLLLFTPYLNRFYYDLTQTQSGTPNIVNDVTYYLSKIKLACALDESTNAVSEGDDHYSAQAALDRGQHLIDHQTLYF